jgi:hypothetical protein
MPNSQGSAGITESRPPDFALPLKNRPVNLLTAELPDSQSQIYRNLNLSPISTGDVQGIKWYDVDKRFRDGKAA